MAALDIALLAVGFIAVMSAVRRAFARVGIVTILFWSGIPASSASSLLLGLGSGSLGTEAGFTLTVRVYDRAEVPSPALERAKQEAARIFAKAGVAIRWLDCPTGETTGSECHSEFVPQDIALRVLAGANGSNSGHRLGTALALENGRFGRYATVYHGAVSEFAGGEPVVEGVLLGYVIAHEVGHLLLGPEGHSPFGVMVARWTEEAVRNAPKARFLFTKTQAARLQAAVAERNSALSASRP